MTPVRRPVIANLLLRLALPGDPVGQSIRGDLYEEFDQRVRRQGPAAARRWFWRHGLGVATRCGIARLTPHRPMPRRVPNRRGSILPSRIISRFPEAHPAMIGLPHDLRQALRSLRQSPTYTAMAALTLALGIGATTTMFSVVDGVLLRPLPYEESGQLAKVGFIVPKLMCERFWGSTDCDRLIGSSAPMLIHWRERADSFEGMAGVSRDSIVLMGDGEPRRLRVAAVTEDFFPVLRVSPMLGRSFAAAEYTPGNGEVALISYGLWRDQWGADPDVLGREIQALDRTLTIVGVLSPEYEPPGRMLLGGVQIYTPLAVTAPELDEWQARGIAIIGRVRPDVTIATADAELKAIAAALAQEFPEELTFRGDASSAGAKSLHQDIVGDVTRPLYLFLGAVGLLLLIGCTNVANLTLARGTGKAHEVAVRAALGASWRQIVRHLLTESLLVGSLGGALGIGLAYTSVGLFVRYNPGGIPRLGGIGVDGRVLLFALALSLLTGIVSGLLPALRLARTDVADALRGASTRATEGRGTARMLSGLVVAEIALALILLLGSGLLFNSFVRLRNTDAGFDSEGVSVMRVAFGGGDGSAAASAFFDEVLDRSRAIPGVELAAAAVDLPLEGISWLARVGSETGTITEPELGVNGHIVSRDYFELMRIAVLEGRAFSTEDERPDATGMVINTTLARTLWPDRGALGQTLVLRSDTGVDSFLVIGIVADVLQDGLRAPVEPSIYTPYQRVEDLEIFSSMVLLTRHPGELSAIATAMRTAVWDVDRQIPLAAPTTLTSRLGSAFVADRFAAGLLGVFATVAVLLAAAGIYGTMLYVVGQRTHEVGIRMALGARAGDVRRFMLRQSAIVTAFGLAFGLGGALLLSRALESLVYDITVTDPATFITASIFLGLVALVASWLPARRASRVDPAAVLRAD